MENPDPSKIKLCQLLGGTRQHPGAAPKITCH